MNIAFVTTRLFARPQNGGEMCSWRLMNGLLRAGHRLHLIGRGPAPVAGAGGVPGLVSFRSVGPGVPSFESLSRWQQAASLLGAWLTRQASTVQRLNEGAVPAQVVAALQQLHNGPEGPLDVVVVDHLQAHAWLVAARSVLPPFVLMMHNLEAQGYVERAQVAATAGRHLRAAVFRREGRLLQRLETDALRHAAAVACLSEGDADSLREMVAAEGSRAIVQVLPGFPLPYADTTPTAAARDAGKPSRARRIGMLGTWTWGPNRDGLDWMLQDVLPRLPPACELVLAGQGLTSLALGGDVQRRRVTSLGRIDDAQGFYDAVDVVALPSWTGSGVHEKSIEAVARAQVVVATPHALRGLGQALPPHVHVAKDAADFAHLCAQAGPGPDAAAATARWAADRQAHYDAALARCLAAAGQAASARLAAGRPTAHAAPAP